MPYFESVHHVARSVPRAGVGEPASALPLPLLRSECLRRIDQTIRELTGLAQASGLHQLILDHADLNRLRAEIDRLPPSSLSLVLERMSPMDRAEPARKAFVTWQYLEFFLKAERGEIRLSFVEGNQSQIVAIARDEESCLVLCHNGVVLRTQSRNDKNLRKHFDDLGHPERQKKWLPPQQDVRPAERFYRFLDQLITNLEQNRGEINSLYIRCSRKRAWEIANLNYGDSGIGRLWFSLLRRYSDEFVNARRTFDAIADAQPDIIERMEQLGWVQFDPHAGSYRTGAIRRQADWDDPANQDLIPHWLNEMGNTAVLRIQLTKEGYLNLLAAFAEKIRNRQLEGFDRLASREFIAKIERGTPTFCINSEELRRDLLRVDRLQL